MLYAMPNKAEYRVLKYQVTEDVGEALSGAREEESSKEEVKTGGPP